MDFTSWVLVAAFVVCALSSLYLWYLYSKTGDEVMGMLAQAQEQLAERVMGDVKKAVPELQQLEKDLKSTWGKAARAMRTYNQATGQADDEDALHALNHPLIRGLAEGAGVDVEAVQNGDFTTLQKLTEGKGGQQENIL